MLNLPRDLHNIVQSMVSGRERIEMWMIEHNITKHTSKAVRDQLLTWYMDDRTDTEPSTLVRISTSTTLQTKLPDGIESVVFICPWVESVPDGWLHNNRSLKRVHFADLSSLTTIGNNWMSMCSKLVSVNFSGLSNLTTVGEYWMNGMSNNHFFNEEPRRKFRLCRAS